MSDDVDITCEREIFELSQRLKSVTNKPRELQPSGNCHFCDEPVDNPKLFCDMNCSQDWTKRNKRV